MRAAPTIDLTAEEMDTAPAGRGPSYAHAGRGAPADESAAAAGKPPPRGRPDLIVTTLVAGFVGAVITAGGLAALWFSGYVPARDAASAVMQSRIASLQTQLDALEKRPAAPATPDTKAIDALSGRLGKLEQAVANLPARDLGLSERLATADNAIKSLGVALTALTKRGDDIAANAAKAQQAADAAVKAVADLQAQASAKSSGGGLSAAALEPLQQRIAALEQSAKAARSEIVQNSTVDKAARLALAAAALRDAVMSGAPFSAELKVAQSLGAEAKPIAALAPFALHGVPSEKLLAHDLAALLPGMVKAAGAQKAPSDFLERLQASAEKLVRVRPLNAPAGDDTAAVLARIELDVANADIAGALTDLGKLPDKVRDVAITWIARAKGREAALAAVRQIAADAARGIGQP